MKIILFFSTIIIVACGCSANQKTPELNVEIQEGTIYANEYGEIELIEVNDTIMRTIFRNNDGDVFDTLLKITYDYKMPEPDSFPLLKLHLGGVKTFENRVEVYEFSSLAFINQFIRIEKIYERPFYKINEKITITDVIKYQKGGQKIDGIYLVEKSNYDNEFVNLTGIITKEKYPIEYYSTDEHPQGMFDDTTITHYRLVVKDYSLEPIKKEKFTGTTMNINGKAAFIWNFADSEAYYLDNHQPWTEKELDKKITIEAVLVQFIDGKSVLKAWQIID